MLNRIKIAIADKNQLMRESLCEFLNLSGYLITLQVTSKYELLSDKNVEYVPDVCLIQIGYREKEIETTINALRKKYPFIKVIVFSIEMKVNGVKVPKFGADHTLPKSCSLTMLRESIDNLTKKKEEQSIK